MIWFKTNIVTPVLSCPLMQQILLKLSTSPSLSAKVVPVRCLSTPPILRRYEHRWLHLLLLPGPLPASSCSMADFDATNSASRATYLTASSPMQDSQPRGVIEVCLKHAHVLGCTSSMCAQYQQCVHLAKDAQACIFCTNHMKRSLPLACHMTGKAALVALTSTAARMQVSSCLAIKGAEDSSVCNGRPHAFEISIQGSGSQYFIAPSMQVSCCESRCALSCSLLV